MRTLSFILSLLCFANLAAAATRESSIDVSFPDEIAGFTLDSRHEFPQQALGVNLAYLKAGPVRGSIFIYNAGLSSIPSGTEAPVIRKHFAQVISEVKQMEKIGKARSVNLSVGSEQTSNFSGCGPQFIWQTYEIDLAEGAGLLSSYTYLTAMKNNFVKLRISFPKGASQSQRDAEQFVQQIRKTLGSCN